MTNDNCECQYLAREGAEPVLAKHHPNCKHHDPLGDAVGLIKDLLRGMRDWASDEDGVHPAAADAYDRAAIFVGEKMLSKEN